MLLLEWVTPIDEPVVPAIDGTGHPNHGTIRLMEWSAALLSVVPLLVRVLTTWREGSPFASSRARSTARVARVPQRGFPALTRAE